MDELKTVCPVTYKMLSEMMELDTEKKIASMTLIYAVIMSKRCHDLSYVQHINSIVLADSGTNTEVYHNILFCFKSLNGTSFH